MAKKKKQPRIPEVLRKQPRIPEVLRKLYGKRVRTLENTILSVIPRFTSLSPQSCGCIGSRPSGCLRCTTGEKAKLFLLRPDDPSDYQKLLNACYIVVNGDAPPLGDFRTHNRLPYVEIVRTAIRALMEQQRMPDNVICAGYHRLNLSSPIVELLAGDEWSLLLKRVGDDLMIYLFKYASIFLPLPSVAYQQVAGLPINKVAPKYKMNSQFQKKRPFDNHADNSENAKKRARIGQDNSTRDQQQSSAVLSDDSVRPSGSSAYKRGTNMMHHTRYPAHEYHQMTAPEAVVSAEKNLSTKELAGSSHNMLDSREPSRPSRMERSRKLRALGGVSKVAEINRQPIFYCYSKSSSVLPQNHVLRSLKPNYASSKSLLQSIFGLSRETGSEQSLTCSEPNNSCQNRSTCLHHSLAKLLKTIIFRTRRCKHLKLLDKHCPVSSLLEDKKELSGKGHGRSSSNLKPCSKAKAATETQMKAINSYCSKHQVVSFIWAVCRKIVPSDLLGTPAMWRILRRNIAKFVKLRRYEKFYLKQCMHKLKTSSFPFLSNKYNVSLMGGADMEKTAAKQSVVVCKLKNDPNQLKHLLLEKWIFWFFSNLIVPLLRANFYITESEHGKQDLFYYRNSAWERLQDETLTCIEDQNYRSLNTAEVLGVVNKRSFGFSKLRILPKEKTVRLVANLKAASKPPTKKSFSQARYRKSVNGVLRDAHAVLRGLWSKEPEKFGSSVFDYNDIHKKLCPFIMSLKKVAISFPDVFIVVSDVSKAFDSVNQDKLLSIMNDVISEKAYFLKLVNQVICTKNALWVQEKATLADPSVASDCRKWTCPASGALSMVLVNQGQERRLERSNLLLTLKELVKRNIVRMGELFYLQGMGIAQGSIVSSLICSLYYGHLDRYVIFPYLKETSKPNIKDPSVGLQFDGSGNEADCQEIPNASYVLLRFIDDLLLITTSKSQASSFYSKLKRGFKDYNCYMNEDKFRLNFDTGSSDGTSFLRWSGLVLNSSTLEIQADYTRYLKNHLSSRLTISWEKAPSCQLRKKLRAYMRPKCHPLFFDSNINSAPVVRLNVFQTFVLSAMKFHCYISEMSYICKLPAKCLLKMIQQTWSYMHKLIKRRMHSLSSGSRPHPVLQLQKTEVHWLAIKAYIVVLKKKQSRHRALLSMLRSKLSAHPFGVGENVAPELKFAVDGSNSSSLWGIKY